MENFKISIPKPCHEDWKLMTPEDKGRFCGACSKLVIDFSVMTEGEIIYFFQNHQNEKVCGHIKKTQLEKIYEPKSFLEKHYKHIHQTYKSSWLRNAYLGVLSSLLLLTGCQPEEKVGDVEAVKTELKKDSSVNKTPTNIEIQKTLHVKGDVAINIPEDSLEGCLSKNSEIVEGELKVSPTHEINDPNHIYQPFEVSEDAHFESGISLFRELLQKEVIYPETAKIKGTEGKVYLQFVVNQEGKIEDIKLLKDIGDGCGEASINAMEKMAQKYTFKPAKNAQGQAVKVKKVFPIEFKL